ncbi:11342_t:CDS:1, partial [Dentiscutata heterogama]
MAFAPLFPITKRVGYTESVTQFLVELQQNPQLFQDLWTVPSINLTQEGNNLGHDKGLEIF